MKRAILCHLVALSAAVLIVSSCGKDDSIAPPSPPSGTVVIDVAPHGLLAPWTLTGPITSSGHRDTMLLEAPPGDYTVAWGAVDDWILPVPADSTQILEDEGTITFRGVYGPTGVVVIDPDPDHLDAPWHLEGPDDFQQDGNGDLVLRAMTTGDYSLAWGWIDGYMTPNHEPHAGVIAGHDTVTYAHTYEAAVEPSGNLVLIPPVSIAMPAVFTMGGATGMGNTEPHQVTLTRRFRMAETEVTNAQYVEALQWAVDNGHAVFDRYRIKDALDYSEAILTFVWHENHEITYDGTTFSTDLPDRPVMYVTWFGAAAYCDWLNMRAGLPRAYDHGSWICNDGDPYAAEGYRLPTEAEWEFACRAGTTTGFYTGDCLDAASEANYDGTRPDEGCPAGPYLDRTEDVGSYPASPWGLFDVHGNVREWCNDWYAEDYGGDATDPVGPEVWPYNYARMARGGFWYGGALGCRSAFRYPLPNSLADAGLGFRPVRTAD